MSARLKLLSLLLAGVGLLLWVRLLQLQVLQGTYWRSRGAELQLWDEVLPARRGRLLDCRGEILADNEPWWKDEPLTGRRQALLAEQQEMSGLPEPQPRAQRVYPGGAACAHVLGYVAETRPGEFVGRDGLELALDGRLHGRPGRRRWLLSATGKRLRLLETVAPVAGEDVRLTLDLRLQRLAHDALQSVLGQLRQADNVPAGCAVAVDATTGRVLALVSIPDFQPGDFVNPHRQKQVAELLRRTDSPLLDRAVAGLYPAASTFKIVSASAALAEGLVPPGRVFNCPGVRWIGGVPFHCFVRRGHGRLSFEETLAHSCDVAFYDLGLELGGQRLHDWATRWGLGRGTGIELPGEDPGQVPDPAKYPHWSQGDEANLAIGQGYLLVTPVQMARVAAGVANRGRLPSLSLLGDGSGGTVVGLDSQAWDRIQAGLRGAVQVGTAHLAFPSDLPFAGKTGTVENSPSSSNPRGFNHTWFIGYGPVGSPRPIAVAVFLERSGGYGGGLAGPVAAAIARKWIELQQ